MSANLLTSGIVNISCGQNVTIVEPCNIYECSFGDNTFVGPFCEIQKGVTIGKNTRVQSHTFICELVSIGESCFISHGVMFTNDLFRTGAPSRKNTSWQQTKIGNYVSIGSNATILPVTICDYVVIGAGAVVTKDLSTPGVYLGNPARLQRAFTHQDIENIRAGSL